MYCSAIHQSLITWPIGNEAIEALGITLWEEDEIVLQQFIH